MAAALPANAIWHFFCLGLARIRDLAGRCRNGVRGLPPARWEYERLRSMPIWMLMLFAVCMLSGVLTFVAAGSVASVAWAAFVVCLLAFLAGLGIVGLRRPVV